MSWADDRVFLDHPDDVQLYDTTLDANGAPGKPGETRLAYGELESGELVLQKRKLFLVSTGATVAGGSILEKKAGEFAEADALAPADAGTRQCAGVVPYGINRNLKGGTALGTLPGASGVFYWAWLVVEGKVDVIADAAVADEAALICKAASAAGRVDDPAIAGLEASIVGRALEAAGSAGDLFEAEVFIG